MNLSSIKRQMERDFVGIYFMEHIERLNYAGWEILAEYYTA